MVANVVSVQSVSIMIAKKNVIHVIVPASVSVIANHAKGAQ